MTTLMKAQDCIDYLVPKRDVIHELWQEIQAASYEISEMHSWVPKGPLDQTLNIAKRVVPVLEKCYADNLLAQKKWVGKIEKAVAEIGKITKGTKKPHKEHSELEGYRMFTAKKKKLITTTLNKLAADVHNAGLDLSKDVGKIAGCKVKGEPAKAFGAHLRFCQGVMKDQSGTNPAVYRKVKGDSRIELDLGVHKSFIMWDEMLDLYRVKLAWLENDPSAQWQGRQKGIRLAIENAFPGAVCDTGDKKKSAFAPKEEAKKYKPKKMQLHCDFAITKGQEILFQRLAALMSNTRNADLASSSKQSTVVTALWEIWDQKTNDWIKAFGTKLWKETKKYSVASQFAKLGRNRATKEQDNILVTLKEKYPEVQWDDQKAYWDEDDWAHGYVIAFLEEEPTLRAALWLQGQKAGKKPTPKPTYKPSTTKYDFTPYIGYGKKYKLKKWVKKLLPTFTVTVWDDLTQQWTTDEWTKAWQVYKKITPMDGNLFILEMIKQAQNMHKAYGLSDYPYSEHRQVMILTKLAKKKGLQKIPWATLSKQWSVADWEVAQKTTKKTPSAFTLEIKTWLAFQEMVLNPPEKPLAVKTWGEKTHEETLAKLQELWSNSKFWILHKGWTDKEWENAEQLAFLIGGAPVRVIKWKEEQKKLWTAAILHEFRVKQKQGVVAFDIPWWMDYSDDWDKFEWKKGHSLVFDETPEAEAEKWAADLKAKYLKAHPDAIKKAKQRQKKEEDAGFSLNLKEHLIKVLQDKYDQIDWVLLSADWTFPDWRMAKKYVKAIFDELEIDEEGPNAYLFMWGTEQAKKWVGMMDELKAKTAPVPEEEKGKLSKTEILAELAAVDSHIPWAKLVEAEEWKSLDWVYAEEVALYDPDDPVEELSPKTFAWYHKMIEKGQKLKVEMGMATDDSWKETTMEILDLIRKKYPQGIWWQMFPYWAPIDWEFAQLLAYQKLGHEKGKPLEWSYKQTKEAAKYFEGFKQGEYNPDLLYTPYGMMEKETLSGWILETLDYISPGTWRDITKRLTAGDWYHLVILHYANKDPETPLLDLTKKWYATFFVPLTIKIGKKREDEAVEEEFFAFTPEQKQEILKLLKKLTDATDNVPWWKFSSKWKVPEWKWADELANAVLKPPSQEAIDWAMEQKKKLYDEWKAKAEPPVFGVGVKDGILISLKKKFPAEPWDKIVFAWDDWDWDMGAWLLNPILALPDDYKWYIFPDAKKTIWKATVRYFQKYHNVDFATEWEDLFRRKYPSLKQIFPEELANLLGSSAIVDELVPETDFNPTQQEILYQKWDNFRELYGEPFHADIAWLVYNTHLLLGATKFDAQQEASRTMGSWDALVESPRVNDIYDYWLNAYELAKQRHGIFRLTQPDPIDRRTPLLKCKPLKKN